MNSRYPHRWVVTADGWSSCRWCGVERRLVKNDHRMRVLEFRATGGDWVAALKSPLCPRAPSSDLIWTRSRRRKTSRILRRAA